MAGQLSDVIVASTSSNAGRNVANEYNSYLPLRFSIQMRPFLQ
jgi:hypothetical protein